MRMTLLAFLLACILLISAPPSLFNGRDGLATRQFETARNCFQNQQYFPAERWARLASTNAPDAATPWLLIGHCFYLQDQDNAAFFYYSKALALDPQMGGHLPPFLDQQRQGAAPRVILTLTGTQLRQLQKKIGQMIMVSVPGTRLNTQKQTLLKAGWIGGVILFSQNIETKKQLKQYIAQLQNNAPTPLFVALDQEGGAVRRLKEAQGFQRLPSLAALGQTKSPDLAYRFGILSGRQLREVGANLNLAPVVDLDHGVGDTIIAKYRRSLGSDPAMVANLARQIVRGMRAENIIATAKHFPSETASSSNPHRQMAVADVPLQELEARDMAPYRALIADHNLDAVMLSHVIYKNVDPYFPASLSSEMIQTLLRRQLGYQGLVISDDLRMDAIKQYYPLNVSVVQAVNAGVDVLLVTDNLERRVMDALVLAVESGKVPMKTIDVAYARIMATKAKYGILALKKTSPKIQVGLAERLRLARLNP
jgi:beta-N-acetylhexosaminidase